MRRSSHSNWSACLGTSCASVFLSRQTDDSEDEGPEPSWKSQEDMVRKLQTKFPRLVKEVSLPTDVESHSANNRPRVLPHCSSTTLSSVP